VADELDELIARDLRVLDDVDVPDLWERIVTMTDTERIPPPRRRRWWPALAASVVLLVAAVIGGLAWNRDATTQINGTVPRPPSSALPTTLVSDTTAAGDNTVRIGIGDGDLESSPTATAGWVAFAIHNETDRIRMFEVYELLGDATYGEVEAAASSIDLEADDPLPGLVAMEPGIGGFVTSYDEAVVGVPLEAAEYIVVTVELDSTLQLVPGSRRSRPLRIVPGRAGQPPTPTLQYQMMGDTPIGDTTTPSGRATITLADGPDGPYEMIVANLAVDAIHADWFAWSPWTIPAPSSVDWNEAPVDSMAALWGTAPSRTLTMDLDVGPIVLMAGAGLDQMSYVSSATIYVE
jgi:hypothetical protein